MVAEVIRKSPVPFFIKPITNGVASKLETGYLTPNFQTHYAFLEGQLETSPDNGKYLCGSELTAADILMSFPMEAGKSRSGTSKEEFPCIWEYVDLLHERESYKRAVAKVETIEGSFRTHL